MIWGAEGFPRGRHQVKKAAQPPKNTGHEMIAMTVTQIEQFQDREPGHPVALWFGCWKI